MLWIVCCMAFGHSAIADTVTHTIVGPDGTVLAATTTSQHDEPQTATESFTSTVIAPDGKAATTTTFRYRDELGYVTQEEVYVSSATGGSNLVDRKSYVLDEFKRPIRVSGLKGVISETKWGYSGKEWETDEHGVTTHYEYDALGRVVKESVDGGPVHSYTYDAMNRRLSSTASNETATASNKTEYDGAGRVTKTVDEQGLATTYRYELGGRREIVTLPGGATRITERYLDGQLKSITGTAQEPQYFEYGVNSDGSMWSKVSSTPPGSNTATVGEKTTTDMLGRTILAEHPAPAGVNTSRFFYNRSQLTRQSHPEMADALYEYDEWGHQTRSGLDVDGDGVLNLARDRLVEGDTRYQTEADGSIWQVSESRVPLADGTPGMITNWIRKQRVSGFAPGVTEESISVDAAGNRVRTETVVNRAERTMTRTTTYEDTLQSVVEVYSNRLLRKRIDRTGQVTHFTYDGLERVIGETDERLGTTVTHYDKRGRVDYVEDPAGNRTRYVYDPTTGARSALIDPLGHQIHHAYDAQGRLTRTWGDGAYPTRFVYDGFGNLVEKRTYRNGTEWSGAAWPDETGLTADVLQYQYDPATGLLTNTVDATGGSTAYVYTPAGRLAATVAAGSNGAAPIVTGRIHDPRTGELLVIDHSDATPDVRFTYNHAGRVLNVHDAAGSRIFTYTTEGQVQSEILTGQSEAVLRYAYSTWGFAGRLTDFSLGPTGTTNISHSVSYEYDGVGRCNRLRWNEGPIAWTWFFTPGGNVVQQWLNDRRQWTSYEYEPHRDLCTKVWNLAGTNTVSQYDYAYDALGRATQRVDHVAASVITNTFAFSPRGELLESFAGSNAFRYAYDLSGNLVRMVSDTGGEVLITVNGRGQCTRLTPTSARQPTRDFFYDARGNLTNDGCWVYGWDAENRLASMTPLKPVKGVLRLTFNYDYQARRIRKNVEIFRKNQWAPLREHLFVYDGRNIVREEIIRHDGKTSQRSAVFYIWAPNVIACQGAATLLCSIQPDATLLYCHDGQDNVSQLVDADSGAVVGHYSYGPLGETLEMEGKAAEANPFRFRTLYTDTETGLLCNGSRYYNPTLGRWLDAQRSDSPQEF